MKNLKLWKYEQEKNYEKIKKIYLEIYEWYIKCTIKKFFFIFELESVLLPHFAHLLIKKMIILMVSQEVNAVQCSFCWLLYISFCPPYNDWSGKGNDCICGLLKFD